ncbi:MAG: HIT family protein [Abitibacteriaceae bacterium]|nr:HIT family protein [Abditibacteriaceae bacterium]
MFNHAPDGYICPFCLFVRGVENENVLSVQSDLVYSDEVVTALISAHQWANNQGHVLIIPNQHFENLFDLPLAVATQIQGVARRLALVMKKVYNCDGISTRQHNEPAGNQDVWHYHLHLFPRYLNDNLYKSSYCFMPADERAMYALRLRDGL